MGTASPGHGMGGLVGCVRAQEVFGAAEVQVERAGARRLGRPDREARLRAERRRVDQAEGIEVDHVDRRRARGELGLRERVNLRAREAVAAPRIGVGRDVEPVCVGPDVGVIAEIRARVDAAGVRSVICDVDAVDVPAPGRVGRRANRNIKVIDVREGPIRVRLERQHHHEPAVSLHVVVAARVGDELGADPRRSVDRRRVAVERVEVYGVVHVPREAADDVGAGVVRQDGLTGGVEHVEDVVHGLDDVAVANAHPLIGRLDRELVSAAGIALLVVVETLEAELEGGIGLRLQGAAHGGTLARVLRQAAIDDRPGIRVGALLGVCLACEFLIGDVSGTGRGEVAGLRSRGANLRNQAGGACRSGRNRDRCDDDKAAQERRRSEHGQSSA